MRLGGRPASQPARPVDPSITEAERRRRALVLLLLLLLLLLLRGGGGGSPDDVRAAQGRRTSW
jgi:hypothetical protein